MLSSTLSLSSLEATGTTLPTLVVKPEMFPDPGGPPLGVRIPAGESLGCRAHWVLPVRTAAFLPVREAWSTLYK